MGQGMGMGRDWGSRKEGRDALYLTLLVHILEDETLPGFSIDLMRTCLGCVIVEVAEVLLCFGFSFSENVICFIQIEKASCQIG